MEYLNTWSHEDHKIGIMENGLFRLTEEGINDTFISLSAAKEYVHKMSLSERGSVNLNLPLMLDDGRVVNIRRIHNGTGKWMTNPPQRNYSLSGYKPSAEVEALIAEKNRLLELRKLNDAALRLLVIEFPQVYSRSPEHIQSATQKALDRYNSV